MKGTRVISDMQSSYVSKEKGNKPLFVIYIGIEQVGTYYQRYVFGFMDLVAKAGGLVNSLNKWFTLLCAIFCTVTAKSKMIKMILGSQILNTNDEEVAKFYDKIKKI